MVEIKKKELKNEKEKEKRSSCRYLKKTIIITKNHERRNTNKDALSQVEAIVWVAGKGAELRGAVVVRAVVGIERDQTALPQLGHRAAGPGLLGAAEDVADEEKKNATT